MFENWYLVVALVAVFAVIIAAVVNWLKLPTPQKIESIKEWLKYAVIEAERELKSGTGQAKLRLVYDLFISKFPEVQKFVPFGKFSDWVDDALIWLDTQLSQNPALREYVYGKDN